MNNRPLILRNALHWLLSLCVFVCGFPAAQAEVICFGSDGHVALENPFEHEECTSQSGRATGVSDTAGVSTSSHSCSDFYFSPAILKAAASKSLSLRLAPVMLRSVFLPAVLTAPLSFSAAPITSSSRIPLPAPNLLRAVILLV